MKVIGQAVLNINERDCKVNWQALLDMKIGKVIGQEICRFWI